MRHQLRPRYHYCILMLWCCNELITTTTTHAAKVPKISFSKKKDDYEIIRKKKNKLDIYNKNNKGSNKLRIPKRKKKLTHDKISKITPTEDPITVKEAFNFATHAPSSTIYAAQQQNHAENQFADEIAEAWSIAQSSTDPSRTYPFLCCFIGGDDEDDDDDDDDNDDDNDNDDRDDSVNNKKSGYERIVALISHLDLSSSSNRKNVINDISQFLEGADDDDDTMRNDGISGATTRSSSSPTDYHSPLYPLYNHEDSSCFAFRTSAADAKELSSRVEDEEGLTIVPFTLSMKIDPGTIDAIDSWFGRGNGTLGEVKSWFSEHDKVTGKPLFVEAGDVDGKNEENDGGINGEKGNIFSVGLEDIQMEFSVKLSPGSGNGACEVPVLADMIVNEARDIMDRFIFGSGGYRERALREENASTGTILSQLHFHFQREVNPRLRRRLEQGQDPVYHNMFLNSTLQTNSLSCSFNIKFSLSPEELQSPDKSIRSLLVALSAIVYQPEVLTVSAIAPLETFNIDANYIVQGGFQGGQDEPFHLANVTGRGQVVAISDTGLDINNCYFYDETGSVKMDGSIDATRRKVIQYIPYGAHPNYRKDDYGGHGTHVAGILGGSGGRFEGIAPNVKLSFFDLSMMGKSLSAPSVEGLFGPGRNAGAKTHNFSWGCALRSCLNRYADMSHNFDAYLYQNQHLTAVVAAGNAGEYGGVSWPGTAKNVITVGSTVNHKTYRGFIPSFSGRGYCNGRPCVDILAPGDLLISAMAGTMCNAMEKFGTSMSAPVVSGIVALIRQYFEDNEPDGISQPSGPLVKAILLNGGQECSTGHPYDHIQGYGLVSMKTSLPLQNLNFFNAIFYDRKFIRNRQTIKYEVVVKNDSTCINDALSVTLAWYDPPAPTLLNDLDLLITRDDTETKFYPNGRDVKDSVNNVERIRIEDVQIGQNYIISVTATNLISSQARYSMVITGCIESPFSLSESLDFSEFDLDDDYP